MELAARLDAVDRQLEQRPVHPRHGVLTGRRPDDEFGEHRIVEQPDLAPRLDARVPAHARPTRDMEVADATRRRQESVGRILARDPALDRPPARRDILVERQSLTGGDAELPLHEVDAGDEFGDRMLHLDARIHLQEVKGAVGSEQELAGPGVFVARRARHPHGGIAHAAPQVRRHGDARRLLDHLLVAPLHGALPLAEREHRPVPVGQHLDFHVPRSLDVLLEIDRVVAERVPGLAPRGVERAGDLRFGAHHAHPLAATAGRRLEQDRITEGLRDGRRLGGVVQRLGGARHDRHVVVPGQLARRRLGAHRRDRFGRRPDEHEPGIAHRAREPLPLGKESVARVDRLCAGTPCGGDDRVTQQVTLARRRRAKAHGLVRFADMWRTGIGVGVHRDRRDPEFPAGPDHAEGNLSAIGDEDFPEHQSGMLPCFFGGFRSRFPCSVSSASMRLGRVSRGSMMSSTNPRLAAT